MRPSEMRGGEVRESDKYGYIVRGGMQIRCIVEGGGAREN